MKKILIIDDEKKIRNIYKRLLSLDGYIVIEAPDASIGYDILLKEKVDLVLLDINMPEVDGDIVTELIEAFHLKTKIIVASVRPISEQKEMIKGALDYYDKSESLDLLYKKIEAHLGVV
ncbi:MAG: response regulator [Candidatus Omnitrophota bacterium]